MGGILRAEPCRYCDQPTYCQWQDTPVCTLCLFKHVLTEGKPT